MPLVSGMSDGFPEECPTAESVQQECLSRLFNKSDLQCVTTVSQMSSESVLQVSYSELPSYLG